MKIARIVFISIILIFVAAELFLIPFVNLPKPHLENNSFIYNQRHFPKMVDENTYVFIGSSAFARDIDCELFPKNCLNLSIDGGDAKIYDLLIHNYLFPLKAKKVVIELSSLVFANDYESIEALDTFINPPSYFFKNFFTEGMNNKLKQSLKNWLDSYLLWSRLNFLSRRQRLAEWPTLINSRFHLYLNLQHDKVDEVFENFYLKPDQQRVDLFKKLLLELRQKNFEVHIISEPTKYQGLIDPEVILNSPLISDLKILAADNGIKFHERLKDWGLREEMLDQVQHYYPEFIPWHTQIVMKMITGESK